jgi:uncharacterized beta-barrel protein YwiB (DUF1934 family)
MFVEEFCTQKDDTFTFSRQQGSDFAKKIAGDFNPLHDIDNKRFCVPGDLLFSLSLARYGVSESMTFDFQGMIGGESELHFEESETEIVVKDQKDKNFMSVARTGNISKNETFVEGLIRSYVAFSGETFPHIIVALMQEEGVMVNAERPMVIYDNMKLSFTAFTESAPEVVLKSSKFDVNGKRGLVTMEFDLRADGQSIGSGEKQIIMSGLRPLEQEGIDLLVEIYNQAKAKHQ